eukprot:CAMPEP_0201906834 /NCGR_PEP_ID=MMETSP0902-20130614/57224_1 /ASSEMBLY_ACC=CAM_ASM_000551 /TAXON_ID=420261 /ORGANISM="Thalassiosira antarctica, Strain CCMP982" /LENGTH=410 /DNA_ID=CAMNT_0048440979 /DNA_START=64 /DNA_END=1296 /DNA_ORIENTATION=-
MLYAASSQRRIARLQRQDSLHVESKRNLVGNDSNNCLRPTSSSSAARPNTANSFQALDKRPTTPCKKTNSSERIEKIRDTFVLTDHDLQHFYRAFCFIAKKGDSASSSTSSSTKPKRERQKNKSDALSNPTNENLPITSPQRPWEEKDAARITLSISDFFATFQLAHTPNGGFLDGIFDLVGTKDLHAMTFGEFLDGVCTFGMFKLDDMVKFVFFILDKEKEGQFPRFQLLRFVESIHGKKILVFEQVILPNDTTSSSSRSNNKSNNLLRLPSAERRRASVDYLALKKLCIDYPTMLEPIFLLQNSIRKRIMGEVWWKRRESQIEKYFRTLDQSREKKRRREEKRLLKERKEKILTGIGWIPYFLRSKSRGEAEKEYPKPIVSLEEETGEVSVEWTRTDGHDGDEGVQTD